MANKEAIQEWITNLRSGEFEQGYGKLKQIVNKNDSESHCCLGVATEIYMDKFGGLEEDIDPDIPSEKEVIYLFRDEETYYNEVLPHAVKEWLGVNLRTVRVEVDLNQHSVEIEDEDKISEDENGNRIYVTKLSELNDNAVSFNTIAQIIEDNFLSE